MEIILSTRNRSKLEQIRAIFAGTDIAVLSLDEAGIKGDTVEDGNSLEENALKKVLFASNNSGKWAVADDSGIFIDALGGEPGHRSARWAGDNLTTEEIMNFTLKKLEHVPLPNRTAKMITKAAVMSPTGEYKIFSGLVSGKVLEKPATECQPQMPYSAIFLPDGSEKSWAEMSVEEENTISHRGQAFRQVRDFLSQFITK